MAPWHDKRGGIVEVGVHVKEAFWVGVLAPAESGGRGKQSRQLRILYRAVSNIVIAQSVNALELWWYGIHGCEIRFG